LSLSIPFAIASSDLIATPRSTRSGGDKQRKRIEAHLDRKFVPSSNFHQIERLEKWKLLLADICFSVSSNTQPRRGKEERELLAWPCGFVGIK